MRVEQAVRFAYQRQGKNNASLSTKELQICCALSDADARFLASAAEKLALSPRSYHKVLKVARTIADLNLQEEIDLASLKEALSYRAFERLLAQLTSY